MADLETAAETAFVKLKELEAKLEGADETLGGLEERLQRVASELESDWAEVEEAAESLLERARATKQAIDDAGEEVVEALNTLGEGIADAHNETGQALTDVRQGLGELTAELQGSAPEITNRGDELEDHATSLAQQTRDVAEKLSEILEQAKNLIEGTMVPSLREVQQAIREMGHKVREEVFDHAGLLLQEAVSNATAHIEAAEATLENTFTDASQHVQAVVEKATTDCSEAHLKPLEDIQSLAHTLEVAMERLAERMRQHQADAAEAKAAVEQGATETERGIQTAETALEAMRELLARFTFV